MSNCCAPKTSFVPDQVLRAVESICTDYCDECKGDAPSLQEDTDFGLAIAMSTDGNVLAIGADLYDSTDADGVEQSDSGAVFVFRRCPSFSTRQTSKKPNPYLLQQVLVATDPKTGKNTAQANASFGVAVSISGDGSHIAVGAQTETVDDLFGVGAVYIFAQQAKSVRYEAVQKLLPQPPFVRLSTFGTDVALSKNGRVLLVGESFLGTEGKNVSFYENRCLVVQKDKFEFKQILTAEDLATGTDLSASDLFAVGFNVKLNENGSTALVSAAATNLPSFDRAGVVFVVKRYSDRQCKTGMTKWSTSQVLQPVEPQTRGFFGEAAVITPDARFIAVEEPGRDKDGRQDVGLVSVYECGRLGQYKLVQQLCPTSTEDIDIVDLPAFLFVKSIAISDNGCTITVGYEGSTVSGIAFSGAVVVYCRRSCDSEDEWRQTQILVAQPLALSPTFGAGMAMSADAKTLAVGAWVGGTQDLVHTFSSNCNRFKK